MIHLRYFAHLRETLDSAGEDMPLEMSIQVNELRARLSQRGSPWFEAFAPDQQLLAAINQEMVSAEARIQPGDEVAFFPPVTGG